MGAETCPPIAASMNILGVSLERASPQRCDTAGGRRPLEKSSGGLGRPGDARGRIMV